VAPTTLYVIDDHPVLREGIRMLVEASGGVHVVGSAALASAALGPLAELAPDVVLLDLDLGTEDGLEWLPRLSAAAPRTKVLVLTALRDRSRDEEALRAGARGLVLKDAAPEVLLQAIRSVAAGALWFDPRVLAAPPAGGRSEPVTARVASLTPREREIVMLVGEGLRNEDVARRLGITEKTVRNHLTAIFDKLGVSGGRLELVVFAYQHGLARVRR
jgi:two-component system, NarL family, nitrate/nitrite response regulator NarL